jgi:hypothetical protein
LKRPIRRSASAAILKLRIANLAARDLVGSSIAIDNRAKAPLGMPVIADSSKKAVQEGHK